MCERRESVPSAVSHARAFLPPTCGRGSAPLLTEVSQLLPSLKAFARPYAGMQMWRWQRCSGDDNDINGCPKTFPYFVPWALGWWSAALTFFILAPLPREYNETSILVGKSHMLPTKQQRIHCGQLSALLQQRCIRANGGTS